jgi:hypothetical protein
MKLNRSLRGMISGWLVQPKGVSGQHRASAGHFSSLHFVRELLVKEVQHFGTAVLSGRPVEADEFSEISPWSDVDIEGMRRIRIFNNFQV